MKKLIILLAVMMLSVGPVWAGPVVLMGIDAEDGGVGGHGPITVYEDVRNSVLGGVTNLGSGILVIGGGKGVDDVTAFWDALSTVANPITYVNGAANIVAQSFAGFAMIAVVSDVLNTPDGGLTQLELNAIGARQADVAGFVNAGGGLLGFSSAALTNPYSYVAGLGAFTFGFVGDDDITPTAAGLLVGITNSLDICCWHDSYLTFPGFLSSLATYPNSNDQVAAIGGLTVFIPPVGVPEPSSLLLLGSGLVALGLWGKRKFKARN